MENLRIDPLRELIGEKTNAQALLDARLRIDAAITELQQVYKTDVSDGRVDAANSAMMFAQTAMLWIDKARKS